MSPSAKIVADSINSRGDRITTFEVTFHRFVLAEFNTHRVLSRNSASSRAIPLAKQLARVTDNPAIPVVFPQEQRGMQGGEEVVDSKSAHSGWLNAAKDAVKHAKWLGERGIHKSIANRTLEPFMWHTAVVTGTAFGNFFDQRCSPLAQPEIRVVAEMMHEAYIKGEPQPLMPGEWHLPYIDSEDWKALFKTTQIGVSAYPEMVKISAARCAQLSYLTQPEVDSATGEILDPGGKRDIAKDLGRYEKLTTASPKHWSPLEHVATPMPNNRQDGSLHMPDIAGKQFNVVDLSHRPKHGNLLGWASLRAIVEAEMGEETYR